jgi:hypothetical protein
MKIETKTIRLNGALHGVGEAGDQVILQIDDLLATIVHKALRQIPEGVLTTLGSAGIGRIVATKVAVDNAWTVDADSKRILLAREGHIERIDPLSQDPPEKIAVEGLPAGTFGASAEPGANRILYVVVRDISFDFSEYGVEIADLMLGRMVTEKSIRSNGDLKLSWDVGSKSWTISDPDKGIFWRWDGATPPARAKASAELKHPSQDLWAGVEQTGAVQKVHIHDSSSKATAETALRPGTLVKNLAWSTSSPARLWGLGVRTLVEMTISD